MCLFRFSDTHRRDFQWHDDPPKREGYLQEVDIFVGQRNAELSQSAKTCTSVSHCWCLSYSNPSFSIAGFISVEKRVILVYLCRAFHVVHS